MNKWLDFRTRFALPRECSLLTHFSNLLSVTKVQYKICTDVSLSLLSVTLISITYHHDCFSDNWYNTKSTSLHTPTRTGTFLQDGKVTLQGGKVTFWLALTALVAVLGGSFPNGYNTAVLNPPEKVLIHFNRTLNPSKTTFTSATPTWTTLYVLSPGPGICVIYQFHLRLPPEIN